MAREEILALLYPNVPAEYREALLFRDALHELPDFIDYAKAEKKYLKILFASLYEIRRDKIDVSSSNNLQSDT